MKTTINRSHMIGHVTLDRQLTPAMEARFRIEAAELLGQDHGLAVQASMLRSGTFAYSFMVPRKASKSACERFQAFCDGFSAAMFFAGLK